MRLFSPGQTWRHLTEKRILRLRHDGKAHSVQTASRKSAFSNRRLTEKRILCRRPHRKAQSPTGASRKSAFCADGLTEKRSLRPRRHQKAQSATAPRPQRDGKAQSAHDASRKAHSAIPRRAKLRLFVRQPSQSAPLAPRDTQCHRIRRGHLRSL